MIKDRNGKCLFGLEAAYYVNKFYSELGKDENISHVKLCETMMNMEKVEDELMFKFIEFIELQRVLILRYIEIHCYSPYPLLYPRVILIRCTHVY